MKGLKAVAAEKFRETLNEECASVTIAKENWEATELYWARLPKLMSTISLIYSSTPETDRLLRDAVVQVIPIFWSDMSILPELKPFISENPKFIIDLMNSKAANMNW